MQYNRASAHFEAIVKQLVENAHSISNQSTRCRVFCFLNIFDMIMKFLFPYLISFSVIEFYQIQTSEI